MSTNYNTGGELNNFKKLQITVHIKDTGSPLPVGGYSYILLNVMELHHWIASHPV